MAKFTQQGNGGYLFTYNISYEYNYLSMIYPQYWFSSSLLENNAQEDIGWYVIWGMNKKGTVNQCIVFFW